MVRFGNRGWIEPTSPGPHMTLVLTSPGPHAIVAWQGELCVVVCAESFFILKYNREMVNAYFESGQPIGEEGVDDAFEVVHEIAEQVRTCVWVGDCLLYTSTAGRLNYTIGSEIITLQHLDRPMYIVGYIKKDNRIYLIDREFSIVSYSLLLSVIEYQTAGLVHACIRAHAHVYIVLAAALRHRVPDCRSARQREPMT